MMLEKLKEKVCEANKQLLVHDLVTLTWGNVSEIDRESGYVVIKPSGVSYQEMTAADMVVVDLEGRRIEGNKNPSSDTAVHLEIYRAFSDVGGIVHTHSTYATAWAQAGRAIPCYGTTHADYIYGEIPCLRSLTVEEIENDYERNTGLLIVNGLIQMGLSPLCVPAVLCHFHGPFIWGKDGETAVANAVVIEEVAKMAYLTENIGNNPQSAPQQLIDKHYNRKHGSGAYYGQQ